MRVNYKLAFILLVALGLGACSTSNNRQFIKRSELINIKDNKSTLSDMKTLFGEPLQEQSPKDGTTFRMWVYAERGFWSLSQYYVSILAWFNDDDLLVKHNNVVKCYNVFTDMCKQDKYKEQ